MTEEDAHAIAKRNQGKRSSTRVFRKLLASPKDLVHTLSKREYQLFKLLAEGLSASEIATTLAISPKTVGVHQTNIRKKLGFQNATQLVRLAIRCNVIPP